MAIQFRRGAFAEFIKSKMVAGEPAVVQSGDTSTQNGKAFYICYTPGSVDRVLTEQDKTALDSQISDIEDDLAAAEQAIENVRQSIPAVDATLTTTGAAADAKKTGDEISDLKSDLTLLSDEIPDTVQTYAFSGGSVSRVTHSRNGTAIRTDVFTYGSSTITEVRTLSTGESLTIITNLTTLETSVTYVAA